MLFHLTIAHDAQECPGRQPTAPPALVGPSDTRDTLGRQLGVKMHFVLWGAACMLWAQPEHVAFAVLEAEDVESTLQFVGALVPKSWTYSALPVWNLPSQLRLIRQVRMAPPMQFGELAAPSERAPAPAEAAPLPPKAPPSVEPERPTPSPRAPAPETSSSGTITRLLGDLDSPTLLQEGEPGPERGSGSTGGAAPTSAAPTRIIDRENRTFASAPSAAFIGTDGPAKGKAYPVSDGTTIGRSPDNQVYIPDERLSREHARIEFRDGSYWLKDLGSKNGVTVNATRVSDQQQLHDGDAVQLGSSTLVLQIERSSEALK